MTGHEIRQRFIDFFVANDHKPVTSAPLVPDDDPTLLFVNAGMVPFKDVFTGQRVLDYPRAVSSQKCLRVSGKHNDFENVGYTPRHHTFFEMLGNFSFGDYFKRHAIALAWEFLTEDLALPADRLWASAHNSDDDAAELWPEVTGIPAERVLRMGDKDNFWAMGDTGPCGPCSEIFWDFGPEYGAGTPADNEDRYLEIWNLVFMQFESRADGTRIDLPRPSVDTGMGLERIAAVVQGVYSNYDSDLFTPLLATIASKTERTYEPDTDVGVSFRVLADHGRAATFLISDGVYPTNEGRGYVLRRIIRRAVRHYWMLDVHRPVLHEIIPTIVAEMGAAFPELPVHEQQIQVILEAEEERFLQTIDQGMEILEKVLAMTPAGAEIPGDDVFTLYDTYGFPPDLTALIATERGHGIDDRGYQKLMTEQRERARKASGFDTVGVDAVDRNLEADSTFVGYGQLEVDTTIEHVAPDGDRLRLVLRDNPFYATGGGQVADTGVIDGEGFGLAVFDVERHGEVFVPVAEVVEGDADKIVVGAKVRATVDEAQRRDTERHHTVTHVIHAILRNRLGEHVRQAGSLVAPDRMRFDFSHPKALTTQEVEAIEDEANAWVLSDLPVEKEVVPFDDAKSRGAIGTGEIGAVKIVSESSVAGGVRRIEVVTGFRALEEFRQTERALAEAAKRLKVLPDELATRIDRLLEEKREVEKRFEAARRQAMQGGASGLTERSTTVDGFQVVTLRAEPVSMDDLRTIGDTLREQLGSGVGVIGAALGGKANLLTVVTDDLIEAGTLDAPRVIRELAPLIGGRGGGKRHMAQAGGKDVEKIDTALKRAPEIVASLVRG
jgi:alanyl-tRNA synthetase